MTEINFDLAFHSDTGMNAASAVTVNIPYGRHRKHRRQSR